MATPTPNDGPPIVQLFLQIAAIFTGIINAGLQIVNFVKSIFYGILSVIAFILAPVLFIIVPLFSGLRTVYETLILEPLTFISTASQRLEDIWAVIGLAIVFGLLVGYVSRSITRTITSYILQLQARAKQFAVLRSRSSYNPPVVKREYPGAPEAGVLKGRRGENAEASGSTSRGRPKRVEWRRL